MDSGNFFSKVNTVVCSSLSNQVRVVATLQSKSLKGIHHLSNNYGIMDTGNNKQHVFKTQQFFNDGLVWHDVTITGVHGAQAVTVGIGTTYFYTTATDNSKVPTLLTRAIG